MAAEAFGSEAHKRGDDWDQVETRGSVGAKEHADRGRGNAGGCEVIIAADVGLDSVGLCWQRLYRFSVPARR